MENAWNERMARNLSGVCNELLDILDKQDVFNDTIKHNIEDIIFLKRQELLMSNIEMLVNAVPTFDEMDELRKRIYNDTFYMLNQIAFRSLKDE